MTVAKRCEQARQRGASEEEIAACDGDLKLLARLVRRLDKNSKYDSSAAAARYDSAAAAARYDSAAAAAEYAERHHFVFSAKERALRDEWIAEEKITLPIPLSRDAQDGIVAHMHEQLHRAPEPCAVCDEWITEPNGVDGTKPSVERSFGHAIARWKQHLAPYRNPWDRKQPRAAQRADVNMSDAPATAHQQPVCGVFVCGVACCSFAMLFSFGCC